MKIDLNSSLFHVTQPCCYNVFDRFFDNLEKQEREYREERADEIVEIPEEGQLDLQGNTAVTSIRRKNLPKDHPEYACAENVYIDHNKGLNVLAEAWEETFEEWIDQRYYDLNRKNTIKLVHRDVWSPREYNFNSDDTGFYLSMPKKELDYIIGSCFDDWDNFARYLERYHSSYDGYMSFVSNNIHIHKEAWEEFKAGTENHIDLQEKLMWVCLDYWLFFMEDLSNISDFSASQLAADGIEDIMERIHTKNYNSFCQNLWDKIDDYTGNGVFYECMEYEPIEEEAEVTV